MDEADAMAERDLGSTFLLPHTHLYKPGDRVNIQFSVAVFFYVFAFVDNC